MMPNKQTTDVTPLTEQLKQCWNWTVALRDATGTPLPETALELQRFDGVALVLTLPECGLTFTFDVGGDADYLALRLAGIDGERERNIHDLKVVVSGIEHLRCVPLDYMSRSSDHNITQTAKEDPWMEDLHNDPGVKASDEVAEIPFLWARQPQDPMGGFAFYSGEDEAREEETFYRIWVNEGLPHPKIDGEWSLERAKAWVEAWKATSGTYSEMYILPHGPEDLKPLAQQTKALGIKNVYLHCDIWRGAFWPMDTEIFHVNRTFFPAGAADLKAYGQYLEDEGLGLVTRIVSGSIGPGHPRYMKPRPHDGISTWLRGCLCAEISAEDTEFTLAVDPGQDTSSGYWDACSTMELQTIAIDDELVKVGEIQKLSTHQWRVRNCQRGAFDTHATTHDKAATFRWLKSSYGFVFVPDPHHPLFDEFVGDYVTFINENRLAVANYDGLEIHRVDPCGANRLLEETYRLIDHPVRANSSGGIPRWAYFQYRLPSVLRYTGRDKPLFFKHQLGLFKIGLHQERWAASGPYDYTYAFVPEIVHGGPISLQANRGFHNLELNDFRQHGLMPLYTRELNAWQQIGRTLPEPIKARIRNSQYRRHTPIGPEQWPCADEQFRLAHHDTHMTVEPFQVLKRPGLDRPFCHGQEFGLLSPKQYIRPAESITLHNPYHEQAPELIIKNLFTFDYHKREGQIQIEAESADEAAFNDMLDSFQGASMVAIEDNGHRSLTGTVSYALQPQVDAITHCGETTFTQSGDELTMTLTNPGAEDLLQVEWGGDSLPRYKVLSSFDGAGGLALRVNGDGSGAILVVRVQACGVRDYVVPIDFTGPRDIEIPSPECSYSEGRWRWMPAYKRLRGGPVTEVRLGFAMVPPKTTASVGIKGLRFLPEVPAALLNPVIKAGKGSLRVTGLVPAAHILWYRGGQTAGVYDLNWNQVDALPVESDNFLLPAGTSSFSIESQSTARPWLECQCITADHEIALEDERRDGDH